jgi:hypothetical protein
MTFYSPKKFLDAVLNKIDPDRIFRFKLYTFINRVKNGVLYDAPADPYKTISIRPKNVEYRISHYNGEIVVPSAESKGLGRVRGGEWDLSKHRTKVEGIEKINYFSQRFEKNLDRQETAYYNWIFDKQEETGWYKKNGFESLENYVEQRLENYEELYYEIKEEGYRENHEGQSFVPGHSQPIKDRLEVEIFIGRDGKIYLHDGQHRFGIARALDLEIPAHVVCRHKKWQQTRDSIFNNGLIDEYKNLEDHPDLQDII